MQKTVQFNFEKMKRLQAAYDDAVESDNELFIFEGNEYLTLYAKYLLEYLKMNLINADAKNTT